MGSVAVARSQSPDRDEHERDQKAADDGELLIPPPSLMGIADPVPTRTERKPVAASGTTRRASWQPTPDPLAARKPKRTDQDVAEPAASDADERAGPNQADARGEDSTSGGREADVESPSNGSNSGSPAKPRWRQVKMAPARPADASGEN